MLEEYITGVIRLAVLASVLLSVAHERVKGAVRLGIGILMISAIMLPIVDIIEGFDINNLDFSVTDADAGERPDLIELAFEEGIARYIAEEYGAAAEVDAVGFEPQTMLAERIDVVLTEGYASADYRVLSQDIADKFTDGGRCSLDIVIG